MKKCIEKDSLESMTTVTTNQKWPPYTLVIRIYLPNYSNQAYLIAHDHQFLNGSSNDFV